MVSMLKEYTTMLSVCVAAAYGGFLFYKFYYMTPHPEEEKKEANTNHLPLEIYGEVLPYMDVKDIWRYRSVCKQWNTLIQSRYFANKYTMQKPTTYKCAIREKRSFQKIRVDGVLATCDGLQLQMEFTNQRSRLSSLILSPKWEYVLFIRNTTTHQSLPIPRPTADVEAWWGKIYAFVFIPSTLEYKVVCFQAHSNYKKSCFVITLEEDEKKWRPLDIPRNPQNQLIRYLKMRSMMVEIGVDVHCIRSVKMGSRYAYEIVSLDLETEYFTILNVYKDFIAIEKDVWPIRWNESLAFVHMDGKELIVKVLEDYKKEKWGETFAVALTFLEDEHKISKEIFPLIADKGLLWLVVDQNKEICYDLKNKVITQTIASVGDVVCARVYSDMPSLVSLKGMQPL